MSQPIQPLGNLFAEMETKALAVERARRAAMTPEQIAAERLRIEESIRILDALPEPEEEEKDEEEEDEDTDPRLNRYLDSDGLR